MRYKVQSDHKKIINKTHLVIKPNTWFSLDFTTHYRSWMYRTSENHKVDDRVDIYRIINKIFENTAEAMKEKEGGVVLEGIGYLGFYQTRYGGSKFYKTKYNNYLPYLFTDVFPNSPLNGWSMEQEFLNDIKSYFPKNQKPKKLYYNEVKAIYDHAY